jgi:hypothetical protein
MDYHIARNGQKLGVFPEAEATTKFQQGEILPSDLVWREGLPAWAPAAEVLGTKAVPPPPPPTPPPPPPPGTGGTGPGAPAAVPTPVGGAGGTPPAKPSNYLVPAILATVLCCLPFGIPAIIFATQVDSKYAQGDYAGAQAASGKAKLWMWLAIGSGLAVGVIAAGIQIAAIVAASAGHR